MDYRGNLVWLFTIVSICLGCMGACIYQIMNPPLNFAPAKTDQCTVKSCTFLPTGGPSYTSINMSIQNTGSPTWTITSPCQVNTNANVPITYTGTGATSLTCASGKTIYVTITYSASSGNAYSITLWLTDGSKITYVATAP
ncbi:MAG TPA: hypothetical protein VK487_05195 [Candidatus Bathyarchaeia archaeon]|nr:hypothetical protein [Candidatus Bathyarchaeia archaeon]